MSHSPQQQQQQFVQYGIQYVGLCPFSFFLVFSSLFALQYFCLYLNLFHLFPFSFSLSLSLLIIRFFFFFKGLVELSIRLLAYFPFLSPLPFLRPPFFSFLFLFDFSVSYHAIQQRLRHVVKRTSQTVEELVMERYNDGSPLRKDDGARRPQ